MTYQEFVKKHYSSVKHLPAKERFKEIAKMYHSQKGGSLSGGILTAAGLDLPKPMNEDGGAMGGAMKMKRRGRKAKGGILTAAGMDMNGTGYLTSALEAVGLGLKMEKKKARNPMRSGFKSSF